MMTPTAGLVLDYRPLGPDTAQLCRVYGESPALVLPEILPGPEGSPLSLTELGSYAFSETSRPLPPGVLRCQVDAAGLCHPLSPDSEVELHPVAGRFLEEISLPDSLRVMGSCAFYNCRSLRRLTAGAGALTLGSDVFLNCFALAEMVLRAEPEQATGLFALVNNLTGHLRALFQPEGEAQPRAAFWYPEYWEDIEESPAHILLHTFSGQGYHYRQCFLEGKILCAEYDAIFPQGHDADDSTVMALLCLDRLRFPYQLSPAAREDYRAFLAGKTGLVLSRLLKDQDLEGIRALTQLDLMDEAAFAQGADLAARAQNAAAAALLADARHRLRPTPTGSRRYDFDF